MTNELLQDSYLTRNLSHLSGIITLGNLKSNIDWHSVIICISLVLNNFIRNRLIGKSSNLTQKTTAIVTRMRRSSDHSIAAVLYMHAGGVAQW